MRKLATIAALTLSTGTAVVGAATTASAGIHIGPLGPSDSDPSATAAPTPGSMDFAQGWCGAPWLWTNQPSGQTCNAQPGDAPGQ